MLKKTLIPQKCVWSNNVVDSESESGHKLFFQGFSVTKIWIKNYSIVYKVLYYFSHSMPNLSENKRIGRKCSKYHQTFGDII